MKSKIVAVIPARMASSRLPGKPLAKICGLTMIEHVRRRAELSEFLEQVIVATCDQEIYKALKKVFLAVCSFKLRFINGTFYSFSFNRRIRSFSSLYPLVFNSNRI